MSTTALVAALLAPSAYAGNVSVTGPTLMYAGDGTPDHISIRRDLAQPDVIRITRLGGVAPLTETPVPLAEGTVLQIVLQHQRFVMTIRLTMRSAGRAPKVTKR